MSSSANSSAPMELPNNVSDTSFELTKTLVGVSAVLFVLSLTALGVRIVTTVSRERKIGLDLIAAIIGMIFSTCGMALAIACATIFTTHTPTIQIDVQMRGSMLGYFGIPIWACAMACTKTGVCLSLLRFEQRRLIRIVAYVLIGIQVIFMLLNTLFPLLQCQPLAAAWDLSIPRSACAPDATYRSISSSASGINIGTDIIVALTPISFLTQLKHSRSERVLLVLLFALGLLVSAVSLAKTVIVQSWGIAEDYFAAALKITILTVVEEHLSVFAACAPWLKRPLQSALERCGVDFSFTGHSETALGHTPSANAEDEISSEDKFASSELSPSVSTAIHSEKDNDVAYGNSKV